MKCRGKNIAGCGSEENEGVESYMKKGHGFRYVNEDGKQILDLAISFDLVIANTSAKEKSTSSHIRGEEMPPR